MAGLRAGVTRFDPDREYFTEERCHILVTDASGDRDVSLARARVEPGVTTAWHSLTGVDERYYMLAGEGTIQVGDEPGVPVGPGDVVAIPAGVRQRITNTGDTDLTFLCVCNPPFTPECYVDLDS